ncbi:MAG TPA: S24 family peptidase [Ignavibacteriales bacterium]|nr:S24 family peptidase [Ignavibacteriales bacterium]
MSIGSRLEQFRVQSGFEKKKDFAEALSMTYEQLYEYLIDKRKPGADILAKLSKLGCDINWLLTNQTVPPAQTGYVYTESPELNIAPREHEYRILATVPAGLGEMVDLTEWYQSDVLSFAPEDHAFIQVDKEFGYSMMPMINPGDLALISFSAKVKNHDLVAAKWDKTKGAIKVINFMEDNPNMAVLTSYNMAVQPIFIRMDRASIYKIVLIKKS